MCNKFGNSFHLSRLGSCWIFLGSVFITGECHGTCEQIPPMAFLYVRWYQIPSNTEMDTILQSFVTRLSGFMDSQPTQENRSEKDTEESQTKAFVEAKAKIFPQNRERATQLSSQGLWTFGFWVGWREISC